MHSEQNPFTGTKLFFAVYFAALILVLTFIGIMGWMGYEMIDASMKFILFSMLFCSALIAGVCWLVRRIWRRWLKVVAGVSLSAVLLLIFAGLYFIFTIMLVAVVPLHYTTLTSPGGAPAVIMRTSEPDEAAQQAAGEPVFIYHYTVHDRMLHFFYEKETDAEGSISIGQNSQAQLMFEWEDERLHLFVGDAEPGDGGEVYYNAK